MALSNPGWKSVGLKPLARLWAEGVEAECALMAVKSVVTGGWCLTPGWRDSSAGILCLRSPASGQIGRKPPGP
jgi:hypothetical protein